MNCDYNALKHMSQTILQQMVEINKYVAEMNANEEVEQVEKDKLIHFANYHLLVLAILMNDCKFVALKEFPDSEGIVNWSDNLYKLGLENKQFTPCKCVECKVPEVEIELVETKA